MRIDPSLDELLEFVREQLVEDARQTVTIEFDIIHPNRTILPTLPPNKVGEIWFNFPHGGTRLVRAHFTGPAWAAQHMLIKYKMMIRRMELLEWDRANRKFMTPDAGCATANTDDGPHFTRYYKSESNLWNTLKNKILGR